MIIPHLHLSQIHHLPAIPRPINRKHIEALELEPLPAVRELAFDERLDAAFWTEVVVHVAIAEMVFRELLTAVGRGEDLEGAVDWWDERGAGLEWKVVSKTYDIDQVNEV